MTDGVVDLEFAREFEFSPDIVFDALVDADLVIGWLGEARIDARQGGRYDLFWLTSESFPPTTGRIVALESPRLLTVITDNRGRIEFRLEESPGGPRGTGTRLTVLVSVAIEAAFLPRVSADWWSSLDQLAELLRGHPVDWANWERDRAGVWQRYLERAAGH